MIKQLKQSRGFTMVELIVVVAVLAVVILTATDLFLSMVKNQRRILIQQEILSQSSYVVEYMSRALRFAVRDDDGECITAATSYQITQSGRGIKFMNHSNNDICQEFLWDPTTLKIQESQDGGSSYSFLSADNVLVNNFKFQLSGDVISDTTQPRVTLFMDVQHLGSAVDEPRQIIQTTISQRNLDE